MATLRERLDIRLRWWTLGFRVRRRIVRLSRAGRTHHDPSSATAARRWAHRVGDQSPRRRLSTGAAVAAAAALAVGGLSTTGSDIILVLALTVALVLTPSQLLLSRRAHIADAIRRLDDSEAPPAVVGSHWWTLGLATANRAERIRLLALVATAVLLLGGTGIQSLDRNRAQVQACPPMALFGPIRAKWIAADGRLTYGCPTSPTQHTADGQGSLTTFSSGTLIVWTAHTGAHIIAPPFAAAWTADGRECGPLGYPVSDIRLDGQLLYLEFAGGYMTADAQGVVRVTVGGRYTPKVGLVVPCRDGTPCIVGATVRPHRITLQWQYGIADAFNVRWNVEDSSTGAETDAYTFTLPTTNPGAIYTFAVQACHKHFLARSTCTPYSVALSETSR